jgi:hypothetical protein
MGVPGARHASSPNERRRTWVAARIAGPVGVDLSSHNPVDFAGTSTGLSTGQRPPAKLSTFARRVQGLSPTGSCVRQVRAASRQTRFIHTIGRALLRPPRTYMNFSKKTVDRPASKKTLSATPVHTQPGAATLASCPTGPDRSPSPCSTCDPSTSGDIS